MAKLTQRETEILELIITGELSSSEIARRLNITVGTVDTHRKNLHKKTATKNSVGLTKYAIRNQIIHLD